MGETQEKQRSVYAGRRKQLNIYLGKFFRLFLFEKQWVSVILSAMIAFLVAKVVGRNLFVVMEGTKTGCLALACVCLWNGMFNSVQIVCRERQMVKREHRSGMSIRAYIGAHMIIQALLCAMQSLILIVMLKLCGVHYPDHGLIFPIFYLDFFITLFLITYASDMMGLLVSCVVHTTTMAMTVMPCILIIQLVFAGVAFQLSGRAQSLSYGTITKWGITALCTEANYNGLPTNILYSQVQKIGDRERIVKEVLEMIDEAKFKMASAKYLEDPDYEYNEANILKEWGVLLAFSIVFAGLGTVSLSFVDHDKR